jgi:hypothetical protein
MEALWNSLEIAKLCVGLLTPFVITTFGIYTHRVTKRFEQSQWRNQELIEKRLSNESIAPDFNGLLY